MKKFMKEARDKRKNIETNKGMEKQATERTHERKNVRTHERTTNTNE